MNFCSSAAPACRWFCRLTAGASAMVLSALLGCGGGGSGGADNSAPEAASPQLSLALSSKLTDATVLRVAQVATSGGVTATSNSKAGATLAVAPADASALVLAADAQGRLVLATLASENELSASSTAVALLWMWIKPVAGSALDDKSFASKARGAAGFDLLVEQIDAALAAGMSPIDSLPVLATLDDVTAAMGEFVKPQSGRISPLAEIVRPRLAATAQLLTSGGDRYVDLMSGNLFVNDTANISVFNGTALYWSAYAQAYDGKRVAEPELLNPVPLADAIRYSNGVAPVGGYSTVLGHPSVSYDLVVVQDVAAQRANAVMLMRAALQAILGTTALAFGDVSCLNNFINSVAPAELEALAAKGGEDALKAYMSAFNKELVRLSLKNLTVSASCGGGPTLLRLLTKHVPMIQTALTVYSDGFAKVNKGRKAGEAIATWYEIAFDTFYADRAELKLGVCVAGGQVVKCATRYALKDNRPWLEGARAVLPLVAFAGDKATLVPSTLAISSQNILPLSAGPDTVVQVLSADLTTTLRIRDEPTGHDSSTVSLVVEPGKIRYASFLGIAPSGPFNVGQTRAVTVGSNSNASLFYDDVDFNWRVAPGFEDIVELSVGGQRLASVKALKPGIAVIYATNSVTKRRLAFEVGVEFTTGGNYWLGTFTKDPCTVFPEGYWFWENPCYNIGVTDGQYNAKFWFPVAGGKVTMESDSYGGLRRVYDTTWNATDMAELRLSFPTEILLPFAAEARYVRFSGTRSLVLNVSRRSATEIGGTYVVTAPGFGGFDCNCFDFVNHRSGPIESRGTGTWSARLVSGSMPITEMNGFDLCFADGGAGNYRDLNSVVFNAGNGNYYTSLGAGGSVAGTCVFGR